MPDFEKKKKKNSFDLNCVHVHSNAGAAVALLQPFSTKVAFFC